MSTDQLLTPRGLERRIKRHLKGCEHTFAAITVPGFEHLCRAELEALLPGCTKAVEPGVVEFCGTMELLYKAHLHCRIANRILLRVDQFTVRSYPELFNKCRRIGWEIYCGFATEISVVATGKISRLHHSDHIAVTVFDAVAEVMGGLGVKVRPAEKAPVTIQVRISDDVCTLSMDASGELLYKRGIRKMVGAAPLRETTASALLQAVSWHRYRYIMDPCCGSGAIVLEALQLTENSAAGANRDFAFFSWPSFDGPLWQRCLKAGAVVTAQHPDTKIMANDIKSDLVKLLENHPLVMKSAHKVTVSCKNVVDLRPEKGTDSAGLIISNLPYGKRIDAHDAALDEFYRSLGTWLKLYCKGWNFAFLVADDNFERKAGITASTVLSFGNGGIPVRLVFGSAASQPKRSS